ncbi:hypothetical protein RchiOBHm_Chr1g0358111 [Rosa chinensis]|uniref:Uncharacterized protein n=1 Tax=Rosa chinensis TaxID=74649 RepID=A0A2P6SI24_ROSCH|nr:hypothetical protein RchiOBHm_Chr1g0358111 [Rosa chinensis]
MTTYGHMPIETGRGWEGIPFMDVCVKEMLNVLILPHSADYSKEVWLEIREKAISVLQTFFFDGVVPKKMLYLMRMRRKVK